LLFIVGLTACNSNEDKADGYGNFEATEVTISAEPMGKLSFEYRRGT
jgi:HlyD family secretion protein